MLRTSVEYLVRYSTVMGYRYAIKSIWRSNNRMLCLRSFWTQKMKKSFKSKKIVSWLEVKAKWLDFILYYREWIISILNKRGMEYLFYYMPPTPNKI